MRPAPVRTATAGTWAVLQQGGQPVLKGRLRTRLEIATVPPEKRIEVRHQRDDFAGAEALEIASTSFDDPSMR